MCPVLNGPVGDGASGLVYVDVSSHVTFNLSYSIHADFVENYQLKYVRRFCLVCQYDYLMTFSVSNPLAVELTPSSPVVSTIVTDLGLDPPSLSLPPSLPPSLLSLPPSR